MVCLQKPAERRCDVEKHARPANLRPGHRRAAISPAAACRGFTLIELLIVIAIIAILALIAIPNFLEAQLRAKVARVLADLRTVSLGLEAYMVDNNVYPLNDGYFNVLPIEITTPIAYVQTGAIIDPFMERELDPTLKNPALARFYTYTKIVTEEEAVIADAAGRPVPIEGIDAPDFNAGAFEMYGKWRLLSYGPDKRIDVPGILPPFKSGDIVYDPTNGSISAGNILRTQKETKVDVIKTP